MISTFTLLAAIFLQAWSLWAGEVHGWIMLLLLAILVWCQISRSVPDPD
jgi:hypothetical protein